MIQGNWQWCYLTGHIRFPVSLPLQLCLYLSPFMRYYHFFPKFEKVMWPWIHPFWGIYQACTSTPLYQSAHKIWSAYLHQLQRYDWRPKFDCVTLTTPTGVSLLSKANISHILPVYSISQLASVVWDRYAAAKIYNGWHDQTPRGPFRGSSSSTGLDIAYHCTKLDDSSYSHSRDITGLPNLNGSHDT